MNRLAWDDSVLFQYQGILSVEHVYQCIDAYM